MRDKPSTFHEDFQPRNYGLTKNYPKVILTFKV